MAARGAPAFGVMQILIDAQREDRSKDRPLNGCGTTFLLGQCEGYDFVGLFFFGYFGVASGGDHQELFATWVCLIGHRRGCAAGW